MSKKMFQTHSNEEISQLIYEEFLKEKGLNDRNVRKRFDTFWDQHQIEKEELHSRLEDRKEDVYEIIWFKVIELEKELVLKRNKLLNTKSDEEIAELFFNKVKEQSDLSFINLSMFYEEIGIIDFLKLPSSAHQRLDKIGNMVWQKVKVLRNQRKHDRIEKERIESFKLIDEIIDWIKEKSQKKLSKINLKLYLSEKKIDLAPVNRQALYLEVNKELESRQEKKY